MTTKDLKRVQEIDTELLLEVDRICRKNNIRYYLFYGTLLGAVRHHGPIPWDDDVDICMTRPNYYRFLEVCESELDKNRYKLMIMGSGSAKYISEIKIGKKNTLYCFPGTEDSDIMHMVQLDIFCLDYIKPKTREQYLSLRKHWLRMRLCKLNWSEKKLLLKISAHKHKKYGFLFKIAFALLHVPRIIFGEQFIEKIGYKLFVDPTGKSSMLGAVGTKSIFNKDCFDNITYLRYLDYQLPVPAQYDKVLTTIYGDYNKLPPEDKRYRSLFSEWVFKEFDEE